MMTGMLSPLMKKIVEDEADYPSPSAKVKLNKAIGRYKLLAAAQKWKEYMDDIKFALADLLVARGDEDDYRESLGYYNSIISRAQNLMIKGRAMIGKAELAISGTAKMSVDEAIKLCNEGLKLLKGDLSDFFVAKGVSVEAELLIKKNGKKELKQAASLFDRLIDKRNANQYFRGRAMAGKAELILYFGFDSLTKGIRLCEEALKIFASRPVDYFAVKARVVEAEILSRRGSPSDLAKATELCNRVISSALSHRDLQARAKLVLAEISKKDKAKKLFEEVIGQEDIDPYLIEKARMLEKGLKSRMN